MTRLAVAIETAEEVLKREKKNYAELEVSDSERQEWAKEIASIEVTIALLKECRDIEEAASEAFQLSSSRYS